MSFVVAEAPPEPEVRPLDPVAAGLGDALRDAIWTGSALSPRSQQTAVGMSEIGSECGRQLAYRIAGTPAANFDTDPLVTLTGTGMHAALAQVFERLDHGMGRYGIEIPCSYRGIPGSADLVDRRRKLVVDWKSTSKNKLRKLRADGPSLRYQVQIQGYAQGLRERGEQVERVAIVFLPRDGDLTDIYVWAAPVDRKLVDDWIDRYERIADEVVRNDNNPGVVTPTPSRLCGWCPHFRLGSHHLDVACPGPSPLPTTGE